MKNREQTHRARPGPPIHYYEVYYYHHYPPAYGPSSHYARPQDLYYAHDPQPVYSGYSDQYCENDGYHPHSAYGTSYPEDPRFSAAAESKFRSRDQKARAPLGPKNSGNKKKADKSAKKHRNNAKAALGAEQYRAEPQTMQTRNRFFSADEAEVDPGNHCFVDPQPRKPSFQNNNLPEQRCSNALSHAEQKSLSRAAKISGVGTAETEDNDAGALGGQLTSEGGPSSFCAFESKEGGSLSDSRLSDDLIDVVLAEAFDEIQVELRPQNTQNPQSVDSSAVGSSGGYSKLGSLRDQLQFEKEMVKNSYKTRQFVWTIQQDEEAANPFAFRGNGRIISKDYRLKLKTELCKSWMESGTCKYGDKCAFAHGEAELQKKKHVASRYKTKPCQAFHEKLFCPYGHRCQFIHSSAVAQHFSYLASLAENTQCLRQRLQESANPFLNEFNLVYQGQAQRLPVFEAIASADIEGSSEICPLNRRGRQTRGLIQSSGAIKKKRAPKQH